jgi:hypothetical protein
MNAYCVILCRHDFANPTSYPRTKRFYVGAPTADRAMLVASDENSVSWASSIATFIRTFRKVTAHRLYGKLLDRAAF